MGTPGLYSRVIGAETPPVGELEGLVREGARTEIRDDLPAELLALALAELTDLALAQYWATDGAGPTLEQIPELVVEALLGPQPVRQR
jgi:hypothetical protein